MMALEDLPDWFDRHHVDIIRTHATTLDGQGAGKYIHRNKFYQSLPKGHAIADSAIAIDIAGKLSNRSASSNIAARLFRLFKKKEIVQWQKQIF